LHTWETITLASSFCGGGPCTEGIPSGSSSTISTAVTRRPPSAARPEPRRHLPLAPDRPARTRPDSLECGGRFAECRAAGYPGCCSQVTAYVARVRPRAAPEPVVRFETPGERAQFDFAEVRFPWGKRFALLVVLGYSRLLYAEFVPRQTALTVMLGLERAFQPSAACPSTSSSTR
jgi:transposase